MGANATTLEVLIQIREDLAGLRKARTDLQGATSDASKLGDALKQGLGIGTGMQIATSAIAALKSAIQQTVGEAFKLAGELKDSSEALNVSTAALQTFRLELKAGGVDAGRLSMAIASQTQSLAEARDSASNAAQAYRALGLDAAAIERLSVEDRLIAIVQATNSATDKTIAFNAAAQILGARGLPQFLGALQRLGSDGVASVAAMYQQQGLLLSDQSIDRLDRLSKAWDKTWHSVVTGSGEAVSSLEAYHSAAVKAATGNVSGAAGEVKAANAADSWGTRFARNLVTNSGIPGGKLFGLALQSVGFLGKQQPAASPVAPAGGVAATGSSPAESALDRRKTLLDAIKTSQSELATILDRSATSEANEALTAVEKAEAKRKALEAEVAARQQLVELLSQAQQVGDFREQSEKDAEMLKAKGDLQRSQNALAAQGNTAAQQQARELFRLETEALAAEAAGNTRLAEQKREQAKQLQLSAQLEGQHPALVEARIAAERQLTEIQRTRAKTELDFSRSIGQIEQQMALVEADNALTERERQAKLLPLLAERNRLTAAHIALLEQDTRLQQGDQTALELQKTIDDLRKQLAEGQAKALQAAGPETLQMRDDKALRDLSDPSQHYQSTEAGAAGAGKSFIAQIGTDGDIAAAAISGGLNSALSDSVSWMQQLANGAITFQEFWSGAIGYVGQMFQRMAIEMVAKMLWRSTVERALIWLGVTTHVQGEAAKTAATTTGGAMRLLVIVKEALASVYHGAVEAFRALAGIPYVGPILGAAAMAAAIAGGISLVSKIGHKAGGPTANVGINEVAGVVHGQEWVAPNWMVTHPQWGPMIEMLEAARTGSASAADLLSADVTTGIAAPVLAAQASRGGSVAGAGGNSEPLSLHVGVMSKPKEAAEFFASADGQKVLIDANRKHARLYG